MIKQLLIFFALFPFISSAQDTSAAHWFDFWTGQWELTWDNQGVTEKGENHIYRTMNDKVIQENFKATAGSLVGYTGMSVSVYNPRTDQWKQTWVDSQGGYLDFVGGKEGERFFFKRTAAGPNGNSFLQRMVFYDITQDAFMWDWERSTDAGKTWTLQWRIQYQRAKSESNH